MIGDRVSGRTVAARAAAWLLRYPDAEVLAALPVVRDAIAKLPGATGAGLRAVAAHRAAGDAVALQSEYVQTFDLRRRCCLYLTYYTAGDTRARGVALVEFSAAYRAAGTELTGGELPDFLPAVLELASMHDAGWQLLRRHRVGLVLLVEALGAEKSIYREAVAAVCGLLPAAGPADRMAVLTLAEHGPPAEMVGLSGVQGAEPPAWPEATGRRPLLGSAGVQGAEPPAWPEATGRGPLPNADGFTPVIPGGRR